MISQQQAAVISIDICSQLQLVSCVVRHGAVYFRATCVSV
jgi:hypothetical protein